MKKTPLFPQHLARSAATDVYGDWLLPAHYGDVDAEVRAARSGAALFDLCYAEKVELVGDATRRFANGMFTNNVRKLAVGHGHRAAMCDDRGRVLGLMDLYCVSESRFLLVLDGVDGAWFEGRYQMYAMLEDIEIEVITGQPWLLSLQGPGAAEVLAQLGLPAPEADHQHVHVPAASGPGLSVMRKDRTGLGGFDLLVPTEGLDALFLAAIAAGATPAGQQALEALRIAAGRARWPVDGTDKSMVHELRFNAEVCAFDKGCYVGQEVINRVDVKGQLTKRLMGVVLDEDALPPAGAEVLLEGEVVGTLTSAVRVLGQPLALGVLRKKAWEPGVKVVVRAEGREVPGHTSELPFAVGD